MKINGVDISATKFAFDGCHKIYLLHSVSEAEEAEDSGYQVLDIAELPETYANSCGLRFIDDWNLCKAYVAQFTVAYFD